MDYDEPHLEPNEEKQPIHSTELGTGALVAAGSLWPVGATLESVGAAF
jgi:hypothetical protein